MRRRKVGSKVSRTGSLTPSLVANATSASSKKEDSRPPEKWVRGNIAGNPACQEPPKADCNAYVIGSYQFF
jgi:hypothetical protein